MAAEDTLKGRRLSADEVEESGLFAALDAAGAGAYYGPVHGYTGDKPAVFFLKPNARADDTPGRARSVQHVCSPPHAFTEEDDGTLTISPSIADTTERNPASSDGWHGYLEHGIWRKV